MFRGPYFILSTMQAGTTPISKVFGKTGGKHGMNIERLWLKSQHWVGKERKKEHPDSLSKKGPDIFSVKSV